MLRIAPSRAGDVAVVACLLWLSSPSGVERPQHGGGDGSMFQKKVCHQYYVFLMVLHKCDMLGQSLVMPKLAEGCNIQFCPRFRSSPWGVRAAHHIITASVCSACCNECVMCGSQGLESGPSPLLSHSHNRFATMLDWSNPMPPLPPPMRKTTTAPKTTALRTHPPAFRRLRSLSNIKCEICSTL